MTAPPGKPRTPNEITGTRSEAETKRQLAGRVINAMKAHGIQKPLGWQVRSLVATIIANREAPTDGDIVRELMRAPWFPKPSVKKYKIGEAGWRTRS